PASVLSGRTLLEIAADPPSVWTRGGRAAAPVKKRRRRTRIDVSKVPGAVSGEMPSRIKPQLASPVASAPEGDSWLHEIKLDGYRILAYIEDGRVTLRSRQHHDWTVRFAELAEA